MEVSMCAFPLVVGFGERGLLDADEDGDCIASLVAMSMLGDRRPYHRHVDIARLLSMTQTPTDQRLYAPAAARNRDAIRDMLARVLPSAGLVLEVASGSGEHILHLARALPHVRLQPPDPQYHGRRRIAACVAP